MGTFMREIRGLPPHRPAAEILDEIGRRLASDFIAGVGVDECIVSDVEMVFDAVLTAAPMSPSAAYAAVISFLKRQVDTADLTEQTVTKLGGLIGRFVQYCERRFGVTDVRQIGTAEVVAFIDAPILSGDAHRAPEERTRDNRRWAVRRYFETLRALDLYDGDPLLDLGPIARPDVRFRPLTRTEVLRCRLYAAKTRRDTRGPATWALAEATATTSEIPEVTVADLSLRSKRVWLDGGAKHLARWGELDTWQVEVIAQHVAGFAGAPPSTPLVYRGQQGGASSQASICITLSKIMRRAGVKSPGVRPVSIRNYAGLRVFEESGSIETATVRLGNRSIDATYEDIGAPWGMRDLPPAHRRPR